MKLYLFAVFLLSGCIAKFVEELYESPALSIGDNDAIEGLEDLERRRRFKHKHHKHHHDHDISDADVTFSAVLQTKIDDVDENRIVAFEKVLVNDEDGYNPTTGIFSAPRCGVYWFFYTVASAGSKFAKARLVVNNTTLSAAVAMPEKGTVQGSNSAGIHMHKGQQAWIALGKDSTLAVGEDEYAYNSFSGGLSYTRE